MSSKSASIKLRQLEEANAATLLQFWAESRGSQPPGTFTAHLMRLALAWDVQVALSGGETAESRRAWPRVIRTRTWSRSPKSDRDAVPGMIGDPSVASFRSPGLPRISRRSFWRAASNRISM